jgi:peptide/nickel transport system permease protein
MRRRATAARVRLDKVFDRTSSLRGLALAVFAMLALIALCAPLLAPYDPALSTGPPLKPPGGGHLLGTNDIGQDVWSDWLWGARASLLVALVVSLLSTALAWSIAILTVTWRRGSWLLLAVTDLLLALPALPLLLLVVALLGPSQVHLMLVLGLLSWPAFARIVRARVLAVHTESYVEAARALGATPLHVALRHIAPATLELLPAKLVLTVRFAIFAEATLAFLGLGDPAAHSWGTMLGAAFNDPLVFASGVWTWWVLPPALGIVAAVLGTTWLSVDDDELDWQRRSDDRRHYNASSRGQRHRSSSRGGSWPTWPRSMARSASTRSGAQLAQIGRSVPSTHSAGTRRADRTSSDHAANSRSR